MRTRVVTAYLGVFPQVINRGSSNSMRTLTGIMWWKHWTRRGIVSKLAGVLLAIGVCGASIDSTHATGSAGVWYSEAPLPVARYGLAATAGLDGRIYAIGGNGYCANGSGYCGTAEVYTPATNAWAAIASLPTATSDLAATTGPDGRIYALGGHGNVCGNACHDLEIFDPSTGSWTSAVPMLLGRDAPGAATGPDGKIYVVGGQNTSGAGTYYSAAEAYSPDVDSWSSVASMPTARGELAVVSGPDGRIYAIGGYGANGPVNTVEAYSPMTNSWSTLAPMPTARYSLAAAVGSDGKIYAFGGSTVSGVVNIVESYDPGTNSWATVGPSPSGGREQLAASASGGKIFTMGGAGFNCGEWYSVPCDSTDAFDPLAATDSTPPSIVPTVLGTLGNGGWYTSDVSVSWSISDPESAISTEQGCGTTTVTSDTPGTALTCTATSAGGTSSKSVNIKRDTTPPTCTVSMTPSSIGPPNHQMVPVSASVSVSDGGSGPDGFVLSSITSNEGSVSSDVNGFTIGQPSTTGQVRAERSGAGSGRVYTFTYTAKDTAGNTSTCVGTVSVAHDKGH